MWWPLIACWSKLKLFSPVQRTQATWLIFSDNMSVYLSLMTWSKKSYDFVYQLRIFVYIIMQWIYIWLCLRWNTTIDFSLLFLSKKLTFFNSKVFFVTLEKPNWALSFCTCYYFHKLYMCSHILVEAIHQKLARIPQNVVEKQKNRRAARTRTKEACWPGFVKRIDFYFVFFSCLKIWI